MAHDLLHGYLPYTHTFDNKPPGIYLVFAGAFILFGETPMALRVASCIAIACGAFAMYRLVMAATGEQRTSALITTYGYVAYTSHLSGLEANTEIFFIPLVVGAFAILWPSPGRASKPVSRYVLAGLMLGVAICIKQSVIYDVLAAAIAIGCFGRRDLFFVNALAGMCGIAFPIALVPLWYALDGHLQALYLSTFSANLRRVGLGISVADNAKRIALELVRLFPLPELALVAPVFLRAAKLGDSISRRTVSIALVWLLVDSAGVLSLGVFESHWILPLLPPLLLLGSVVAVRGSQFLLGTGSRQRWALGSLLALSAVIQLGEANRARDRDRPPPARRA